MTKPAYTLKQLARAPNVVRAAVIENERRITDLEAENARLQANLEVTDKLWREDKALAERRGEALRKALPALRHYGRPHEQGNLDCPRCPVDAALAATPELTNC